MSPAINRADALCTILFDVVCALIGIIGTSPLWIVGIVGILVSDWGPIFYTAHRIGKDNKPFLEAMCNKILEFKNTGFKQLHSSDCRKRAEECFDKDRCFEKYVELYERLLKTSL